ncbi:MAG: Nitrogen regulatory protein P-II, partial [uncultured Solirubrobacteraceae bacterium]
EDGHRLRPSRGFRADPDRAAGARVPVPDGLRGQGLGPPARHHRALPRGAAHQSPASQGQDRVRGGDRRRADHRRLRAQARPHRRRRRREGVRPSRGGGLPSADRRVRRRDSSGPPRDRAGSGPGL